MAHSRWNTVQDYLDCDNAYMTSAAARSLRPLSQEERARYSVGISNGYFKRRLLGIQHRPLDRWELRMLERIQQGLPARRTREEIEKSLWSDAQRQRHSLRMKEWARQRREQGLPMGGVKKSKRSQEI